MFAALNAAERGCEVHLFEKNEKLGKKIYITGKGRCNLTNAVIRKNCFRQLSAIRNSCTVLSMATRIMM